MITPPPLSPRLGPHLIYPANVQTIRQRQDFEWKVLTDLANDLPAIAYARINWPYGLKNGLPWQQLGWQQTVRYSYMLDLSQAKETLFANFKSSLRNKIRKAEKQLTISSTEDYHPVLKLSQLDFAHRGDKSQLNEALIARLDTAAKGANARQIWLAQDVQGRIHGAIWLLHDSTAAYNLLLGTDPQLRSSGAAPLLLWHAIQWAQAAGLPTFDFEGSHLPGVEPFFRSFGGEAQPYYQFVKAAGWLQPLLALRSII